MDILKFCDKILNTIMVFNILLFYKNCMSSLLFSYKGNSRELRKIIVSLLKSGCTSRIQKFNYVQNFELKESVIEKSEMKYIVIYTEDESKLLNFVSKNFPQVERVVLK